MICAMLWYRHPNRMPVSIPERLNRGTAMLDTIIIGSGFGGSVAANRLALAGQTVMVLERGPWRDSVPVRSMGVERRSPYPYGLKAITHLLRGAQLGGRRLTLNKAGMYEFFAFPGLWVLAASAVGGASTAWGGLLETPHDPRYWQGHHPELDAASIEAYYPKIFADLGATPFTPDLPLPHSIWTHMPATPHSSCAPAAQQPDMAMLLPRNLAEAGRAITTECRDRAPLLRLRRRQFPGLPRRRQGLGGFHLPRPGT